MFHIEVYQGFDVKECEPRKAFAPCCALPEMRDARVCDTVDFVSCALHTDAEIGVFRTIENTVVEQADLVDDAAAHHLASANYILKIFSRNEIWAVFYRNFELFAPYP